MKNNLDTDYSYLIEAWGVEDNECIGFYHYDEEEDEYVVEDLRKTNFDHILCYPGDEDEEPIRIVLPREYKSLKQNEYYRFRWVLTKENRWNQYEITIDDSTKPQKIDPKWFIDILFDGRYRDKSKNFSSATNFLDTLSKQLSANDSTFVYELLQNANDYPVEGQKVDVQFHITENYLLFLHSGEKFNVRNISGICGINEKEKVANKKTIGYKGIGFKTVFLNNDYVYLKTGDYSFRFDKSASKIIRQKAPWPILPVWTEYDEIDEEVNEVFDNADESYNVQIALKPKENRILHVGPKSYEKLFNRVFSDSNIILFIPNISTVSVFINNKEVAFCERDESKWIVNDYEEEIEEELQSLINKTIEKGNSRIPEKYKDFDCTKVSFACRLSGDVIEPVAKATLYCYLPTKASWGLPFLLNTDMIPKGDRNDIESEVELYGDDEDRNFNVCLAEIAGAKLYDWINDLIQSEKYDINSIFKLIPDFEKCKEEHEEYETYISQFQEKFEERLCDTQNEFLPTEDGYTDIKHIVYDTIGLSSSGIMSDEEFRQFSDIDYPLPLISLREDKVFKAILDRYVDEDQRFDKDKLTDLIRNEGFKEWLEDQDNNNAFLKFLLDKGLLGYCVDEEIFKGENEGLYEACDLIYDIDKYLDDLQDFSEQIPYLSIETRNFFKGNRKWSSFKNETDFKEFDCNDFVYDELLASAEKKRTLEKLNDDSRSMHFFKFLAENVDYQEELLDLPFIDDEGNVVEDFHDKFLFTTSEEGHDVCESNWMSDIETAFVSGDYDKVTIDYFKKHFGVSEYSDKYVIEKIVLSDECREQIESSIIQEYETSLSFIEFCHKNEEFLENGDLKVYSLKCYDKDGDEAWCLTEEHVYFGSEKYDEYSSKEWIENGWMYAVDSEYYQEDESIKDFIHDKFEVKELTDNEFFVSVVKPNTESIFRNVSGSNDSDGKNNIDFVGYLDKNYNLIFNVLKLEDSFEKLELVSEDIHDIDIKENTYLFDDELLNITQSEWFPAELINICHHEYGDSLTLKKIGCKKYKFNEFFDDVIAPGLSDINDKITDLQTSIDFHHFFMERIDELTNNQKAVLKKSIVYLYGGETWCDKAEGHKILSKQAKELNEKGLVEFSDLDIIDPDYKAEENADYWENTLGNTKFTVKSFLNWLKENTEDFKETIEDRDLNIEFWRWLKNSTKSDLTDLPCLPLLLDSEMSFEEKKPVYFSDTYMTQGGIEAVVKLYDEEAQFISPDYIDEDDDVEEWREFFTKVGVKYDIVDILVDTVIPNLERIEREELPQLLAKNREILERRFHNKLIENLSALMVKAKDGKFYALDDAVYVDSWGMDEEPFPYIKLHNQVCASTTEEGRLIKDIISSINGNIVVNAKQWRQYKIDQYIAEQEDDSEEVSCAHYQLIEDLAKIHNERNENVQLPDNIEQIKLYDREGCLVVADDLTLGSCYSPYFDFEECGVDDLEYISDSYKEKCNISLKGFFNKIGVHCDFEEDDIDSLTNRECSLYFWTAYLTKGKQLEYRHNKVKRFIEKGLLNDIECIPTADLLKQPSELYYGDKVDLFRKVVEGGENKYPLDEICDIKLSNGDTIFGLLPFKDSLDFLDALYALLAKSSQDNRVTLLQWMIESYNEKYDSRIMQYREDDYALWFNNKNKKVQIKELYALDYDDRKLEQYFDKNPRIIKKSYLPAGKSFKKACDILKITTITSEDLEMQPVDEEVYTKRNADLKLFALVIAGVIDSDNWQTLYNGFCNRLENLKLHKCRSIRIYFRENEEINQTLRRFYHEDDSDDFYFVDDLDSKHVFTSFVEEFKEYIGVDSDDISEELVSAIMDSRQSALDEIQNHNDLLIDSKFTAEVERILPNQNLNLEGNKINENDGDDYRRGTFTAGSGLEEDSEETESQTEIRPASSNRHPMNKVENLMDEEDDVEMGGLVSETDEPDIEQHPEDVETDLEEEDIYSEGTLRTGRESRDNSRDDSYDRKENTGEYHSESKNREVEESGAGNRQKESSQYTKPNKEHQEAENWNNGNSARPKQYSRQDVEEFRGKPGKVMNLDTAEATNEEIAEINELLDDNLSAEEIADHNYLAQLRLYKSLEQAGLTPDEDASNFIRNGKEEQRLQNGKFVFKCSAKGGILYLSPYRWRRIADGECIVCVYYGERANEFKFFHSIGEILEWINEDDILIKLRGANKSEVVKELYEGVLKGSGKGQAYTLIRVKANVKYDSLFESTSNEFMGNKEEDLDDY